MRFNVETTTEESDKELIETMEDLGIKTPNELLEFALCFLDQNVEGIRNGGRPGYLYDTGVFHEIVTPQFNYLKRNLLRKKLRKPEEGKG